MKYFLITFGCQMNKSDSERIAFTLENIGYKKALKKSEADLIIVNMCSVRQSAVDRVYGLGKEFKKLKIQNPKLKSLLTGCVLKKDFEKFKKIFDFILPIKTLFKWKKILKEKKFYFWPNQRGKKFLEEFEIKYFKIKPKFNQNFSAFIPISTGCNNFCSFCVVPFVRGPLICRDFKEILKEVKEALKKGAKEIWLLGQNVNDYKFKLQNTKCKIKHQNSKFINFAKLLEMVNEIKGNFWIRFTSPHPKNFSEKLIESMARSEKFAPYLNLPLQSGDDEILRKMKRDYTSKEYQNLVKKIRLTFKKYRKGLEREVAISTDIIVGFPGERKKQFQKTVKLLKKIKFDMAYIAKYSPRPQTSAFKLKDNVSQKEKERRFKILTQILKKTALEKNKKFKGKIIEVLVQGKKGKFFLGKNRHYKTVKFKGEGNLIGSFQKVKIINVFPFGLEGVLIEK